MNGTDRDTTPAARPAGNDHRGIGRRWLLGGAGGAVALGGAAAPAGAVAGPGHAPAGEAGHPDAALLVACAAFHSADARVKEWDAAPGFDEAAGGAAIDDWYAALIHLTGLRARTAAGLRAKAHAALTAMMTTENDQGQFQHEEAAALAVLQELAAGGVA